MIKVDRLTKHYGSTVAVDAISFEFERGEIVGFLGPNGAGKTSTMRMLTGFIPATSGAARVAGHDVSDDSLNARRCIGYMPEGVPLYPEMRVREYLEFRARIKTVPPRERARRVDYVMDRCGLTDVQRKLIGSLSKGSRQRVGLAEAFVHDPPVLILDEPTIGLDPNQIRQARALIRDLGRDHTVLLSTHILPEVEMVCDRVIIIHRGRLAFQGRVADIAHPAGGAKVVVEMRAPVEDGLATLRGLPGVLDVRCGRSEPVARFELTVQADVDAREEISRRAASNGWALLELRREAASLEDIFVHLTAQEED
jgi:ABC-2 type transport system ATP-binding protein